MPPSIWHFTPHDNSPLSVVTMFRQNLSRAGERMWERTSEGKKIPFSSECVGDYISVWRNEPVRNLLAYLGHWKTGSADTESGSLVSLNDWPFWHHQICTCWKELDSHSQNSNIGRRKKLQLWNRQAQILPLPLLIFLLIIDLSK